MAITSGLAIMCAMVAAIAMAGYLLGLKRIERMRPLATITLFCSAMALWQLGVGLLSGMGPRAYANVVFAAAFMLLGALGQIAAMFRVRAGESRRDLPARRASDALPEAAA